MSGLRVNLSKSVVSPIGDVLELQHVAKFFGFDYLPSSYLGLPLGANFQSKAA